MLRFYRNLMEQILLSLLYVRDQGGDDFRRSNENARENWRQYRDGRPYHTPATCDLVGEIFESNEMEFTLSEMINQVESQIRANRTAHSGNNDRDLIDTIVRTLQLPYSRNRLSGDTIESLKKAILLPEEIAALKERLSREEMSCVDCGHKFKSGEIASFINDRGKTAARCTNCYHPTFMASGCTKHSIGLPPTIQKAIMKEAEKPCEMCKVEVDQMLAGGGVAPPDDIGHVGGHPGQVRVRIDTPLRDAARAYATGRDRPRPAMPPWGVIQAGEGRDERAAQERAEQAQQPQRNYGYQLRDGDDGAITTAGTYGAIRRDTVAQWLTMPPAAAQAQIPTARVGAINDDLLATYNRIMNDMNAINPLVGMLDAPANVARIDEIADVTPLVAIDPDPEPDPIEEDYDGDYDEDDNDREDE